MNNYTIIILNKSNNKLLFNCIDSIIEFSKVITNFRIIIGDTGSDEYEIKGIEEYIADKKFIELVKLSYYNFAINNNYIVDNYCKDDNSEILVFCNNDIQFKSDVLFQFQSIFNSRNDIGTVGCKLLFGDKRIQHAGIEIGVRGRQFYITHRGLFQPDLYIYNNMDEVVGNTAALMAIKKDVFYSVGKFPVNYIECFEDVELNVNCILKGYKNIYCGNVEAYHFESCSRNKNYKKDINMQIDFKERLVPLMQNFLKNQDYFKKYLNVR